MHYPKTIREDICSLPPVLATLSCTELAVIWCSACLTVLDRLLDCNNCFQFPVNSHWPPGQDHSIFPGLAPRHKLLTKVSVVDSFKN